MFTWLSQNCNLYFRDSTGISCPLNARRFDDLIHRWRTVASGLPDPRTGDNTQFEMADIALPAFAVFFTQCPSFLSFQQNMEIAQGRNHARSLFQVGRIPTD